MLHRQLSGIVSGVAGTRVELLNGRKLRERAKQLFIRYCRSAECGSRIRNYTIKRVGDCGAERRAQRQIGVWNLVPIERNHQMHTIVSGVGCGNYEVSRQSMLDVE